MPISVNDLDQSNFSLFGLIPPLISGIKISSDLSATTDMPLVVEILSGMAYCLFPMPCRLSTFLTSSVIFTFLLTVSGSN